VVTDMNGASRLWTHGAAGIALVFGVVTVAAGAGVLAGRDPGYLVYQPLLIFNTVMGVAYAAAAVLIWRNLARGRLAAAVILALNLAVLGLVVYLFRTSDVVAVDSVRAMAFRSAVWLVILGVLVWMVRRQELSK
jgi:ACR3 family arsenite efflux pump ArsB